MNWKELAQTIKKVRQTNKKIMFLVGAGLSAESGIPTFRGKDGFWKVGSVHYTPEEIGTYSMFCSNAMEVWKWFLFRKTICKRAKPNRGHLILKEIEDILEDQFVLLSQNVDSLHKRAGSSLDRTFLVHGDLDYVRCGKECTTELYPFSANISDKKRDDIITPEEQELLKCPKCGEYLRPHVLWFDEIYNEQYYKFRTVQSLADQTGLLILIGTSGVTALLAEIIDRVSFFSEPIVDINISEGNYSDFLMNYPESLIVRESSTYALEKLLAIIKEDTPN